MAILIMSLVCFVTGLGYIFWGDIETGHFAIIIGFILASHASLSREIKKLGK